MEAFTIKARVPRRTREAVEMLNEALASGRPYSDTEAGGGALWVGIATTVVIMAIACVVAGPLLQHWLHNRYALLIPAAVVLVANLVGRWLFNESLTGFIASRLFGTPAAPGKYVTQAIRQLEVVASSVECAEYALRLR